MNKEKVIETVQELPNEFDLDQLIDKLVFMEKVEKGLAQLEKGETKPHDYVKQVSSLHLNQKI